MKQGKKCWWMRCHHLSFFYPPVTLLPYFFSFLLLPASFPLHTNTPFFLTLDMGKLMRAVQYDSYGGGPSALKVLFQLSDAHVVALCCFQYCIHWLSVQKVLQCLNTSFQFLEKGFVMWLWFLPLVLLHVSGVNSSYTAERIWLLGLVSY